MPPAVVRGHVCDAHLPILEVSARAPAPSASSPSHSASTDEGGSGSSLQCLFILGTDGNPAKRSRKDIILLHYPLQPLVGRGVITAARVVRVGLEGGEVGRLGFPYGGVYAKDPATLASGVTSVSSAHCLGHCPATATATATAPVPFSADTTGCQMQLTLYMLPLLHLRLPLN